MNGLRGAVVCALLLAATVVSADEPALTAGAADDGFTSMINGKDLSQWEGDQDWWEVRDGTIVAESTPQRPCKRSHYLYWKGGEPGDFDLRFSYRISGAANSGVQFRSERRPQWDTWGYQADCDSAGTYTGCLYQHGRGLVAQRGQKVTIDAQGQKSIESIGDFAKLLEAVKADGWNEYRILAEGPKMTLWLNGTLMCEVEDHEPKYALRKGIVALQMHQGPPMKVEFKDLRIRLK